MKVKADDGRVYIPKEKREKYGDSFELIDRGDKMILYPVPDDPLQALRDEVGDVDKSVKELKEEARETAMELAGR
ncbi:MAG: AbrB/MazE/SpoVT family DNA-binding domain-containing protein [Candidatus Aenigmatarchaeota archaeon]